MKLGCLQKNEITCLHVNLGTQRGHEFGSPCWSSSQDPFSHREHNACYQSCLKKMFPSCRLHIRKLTISASWCCHPMLASFVLLRVFPFFHPESSHGFQMDAVLSSRSLGRAVGEEEDTLHEWNIHMARKSIKHLPGFREGPLILSSTPTQSNYCFCIS